MAKIEEISESMKEWERVSAHSHVVGLGLKGLKAQPEGDGLVGQTEAREAAGIVVKLVREGKFAGRAVLLAGIPGSGKTALALGIAKELGRDVPFVPLTASEIYSTEMKKTEFLMQSLRKAIGVRITEMREIYEGVVDDLDIKQQPHPFNPYQQVPSSATVRLTCSKESKKLSMDQAFAMQFMQQQIQKGDVVQIDVEGGKVAKLGKSEKYAKSEKLDLTGEQLLPIPEGKVQKEKEFVYTLTLHHMDMINARRSGGGDLMSMFFGGGGRSSEIDQELRQGIDASVRKMVEEGKAEILPGVVFIDECSMLDIESFAFVNRAMESDLAPIVIFATNRGTTEIRGTSIESPHGMPIDLLDRLLIINTRSYKAEEINKIIRIRATAEDIKLEEDALKYLTEVGEKSSLRYSIQLLAPSLEIAKENKSDKIQKKHVEQAETLFIDVKRSVKYLKEYEKSLLK